MSQNIDKVIDQLTSRLGESKVKTDKESLQQYQSDMTELIGLLPNVIVSATNNNDIQIVLEVANQYIIPVIPVVANTNLGGLTLTGQGGIILQLSEMNKIMKVDSENQFMVIEPGVTFGQVKQYLDTHYPELRFGYPLSPPYTSVMANCLMDGLGTLSYKYGSMGDWINGLEVVLANGEILKTGIAAISNISCCNSPMPDLTGLFINFQGTTGIVTKMAIQLWPAVKFRKRFFIMVYKISHAVQLMNRFSRESIFDDIAAVSYTFGKMLFGETYPKYLDPNEPVIYIYVDLSGNYSNEIQVKIDILDQIVTEFKKNGYELEFPIDIDKLIQLNPDFSKFTDLPATLDFLLDHGGGGLTWVGTYGPTSNWISGMEKSFEIMKAYSFPQNMVSRVMRGGHFGVLRLITLFDKNNSSEVDQVRKMNLELVQQILPLGFFPYKTPRWVINEFRDKFDPTFLKTVHQIQTLLDPNGILNPGNWR